MPAHATINFSPATSPALVRGGRGVSMASKDRIAVSFIGLKAEAEGVKGIAAFLVVAALLFAARWIGLL